MRALRFTPAERRIALLVLEGKSNTEIARELGIGLSWIKQCNSSMFEKAEVRNRTRLVVLILETAYRPCDTLPVSMD